MVTVFFPASLLKNSKHLSIGLAIKFLAAAACMQLFSATAAHKGGLGVLWLASWF